MQKKFLFSSLVVAITAVVASAHAAVVTSVDFSAPITTGPTQAAGTWYTDRYAPAAFQAAGGELVMTISSNDSASNRPSGFGGSFYDTQGRKLDLGAGAKTLQVDLFVDSSWGGSNLRQAGLWGTAFDTMAAISFYPIIEYFNSGFRGWNGVNGWINLGAGNAGAFNTIGFVLNTTSNQWNYMLNGVFAGSVAAEGSKYIGNVILQGHNNYGQSVQGGRQVRFDNLLATTGQMNVVPEPAGLALVGLALLAAGVATRRRQPQLS